MKKNRNIPFGYCMINGKYAVNSAEASAVKQIFTEYSDGKSLNEIAAKMTVPYHSDKPVWNKNMVKRVLENRRYIGECGYPQIIESQIFNDVQNIKSRKNTRTKIKNKEPVIEEFSPIREYEVTENIRRITNEINRLLDAPNTDRNEIKRLIFKCAEEKYKYLVKGHHEPIISHSEFDCVQAEMARRKSKRKVAEKLTKIENGKYSAKFALSELLICGECGTPYRRVTWTAKGFKEIKWRCVSRLQYGKKYCHNSPTIDEGTPNSKTGSPRVQKGFCRNTEALFFAIFPKNLFSYTKTEFALTNGLKPSFVRFLFVKITILSFICSLSLRKFKKS